MDRYQGKRFAAFLILALLLAACFVLTVLLNRGFDAFGQLALYLAGGYSVYLTGQSFTDGKKIANGNGQ